MFYPSENVWTVKSVTYKMDFIYQMDKTSGCRSQVDYYRHFKLSSDVLSQGDC